MKKIILLFGMTILLSSCHIYKSYKRPDDIKVDSVYRAPVSYIEKYGTNDTLNIGNIEWKNIFTDPLLQGLIVKGLNHNVNLQTAILRLDEAKSKLNAARLSYLPSLNLAPNGNLGSFDRSSLIATYTLPVSASWEIDLFAKLLNANRAVKASLLQSEAYRQAVQSQLIANIANAYYSLLMLDQQVIVTSDNIKLLKETVRTMEAMKEAGMTNEAALSQSRGVLYQTEASLSELKRQVVETENSLCVVMAENPHSIKRGVLSDQKITENISAGIPLQLLANRPDVKVAEMALAASYYQTNQARAAFYPSLTITGSAGWTNNVGSAIMNPAKTIAQAAASLTQPIFARGKLVSNLRVSKDEEKIALMNYQQTILNAGKEVSNALYQYESSSQKLQKHMAQKKEMENAVYMTKELFKAGKSTYLEILTAQQSLLSSQLNEVSDRCQILQSVINLYSAVGGAR